MMYTATLQTDVSFAVRYPRGGATGMPVRECFSEMPIGRGICIKEGENVAILSYGTIGNHVTNASKILSEEGIEIGHYNMRFVKPLDTELISEIMENYDAIITIEDATRVGGFGSAVAEYMATVPSRVPLKIMGVPDALVEHGTQAELYSEVGLDSESIVRQVKEMLVIVNS